MGARLGWFNSKVIRIRNHSAFSNQHWIFSQVKRIITEWHVNHWMISAFCNKTAQTPTCNVNIRSRLKTGLWLFDSHEKIWVYIMISVVRARWLYGVAKSSTLQFYQALEMWYVQLCIVVLLIELCVLKYHLKVTLMRFHHFWQLHIFKGDNIIIWIKETLALVFSQTLLKQDLSSFAWL